MLMHERGRRPVDYTRKAGLVFSELILPMDIRSRRAGILGECQGKRKARQLNRQPGNYRRVAAETGSTSTLVHCKKFCAGYAQTF